MRIGEPEARGLLVRGQRLDDPGRSEPAAVADAVRAVVGIQAQDSGAASLGVRARLAGSTGAAVGRALHEERSVARIWCMRGTLHLVAAEDLRWLVSLLGPVGLRRNRKRMAAMGVDNDDALRAVRATLADQGPLTRQELADHVRLSGVRLADDPQAPAHLVGRAAFAGVICEAAPRRGRPAYVLTDDWLAAAPDGAPADRDAALAELARRYVAAHPPAAPHDLAAWSGLPMPDARAAFAAIEHELRPVAVLGREAWIARDAEPAPARAVRLLPAWDNFLLAHRDRALTLRPENARAAVPGGGILRPTLMVDGRIEGTWRLDKGEPAIAPFAPLGRRLAAAVEAEAADVVRHRSS